MLHAPPAMRHYKHALVKHIIVTVLAFFQFCSYAQQEVPVRRWEFNEVSVNLSSGYEFKDLAIGEISTLRGNGASLNGAELVLSSNPTIGNTPANTISSYLDLPNGIVSSRSSSTFEIWLRPLSSVSYQRVFDFGRSHFTSGNQAQLGEIIDGNTAPGWFVGYQNILLTMNDESTLGQHLFGYMNGVNQFENLRTTNLSSSSSIGSKYQYVMTIQDSSDGNSCNVKWYRNGIFYGAFDLPYSITKLHDVNNWIGRSMWGSDKTSHFAIDDLRIYDLALNASEVQASYIAGSSPTFLAPICQDDHVTVHQNHKVLIDVLANDNNTPLPHTVEIITPPVNGQATVHLGKILYIHSGATSSPTTLRYRVRNISGQAAEAQVTVAIANSLRITNPKLAMPLQAPASDFKLIEAFPGLSFQEPICLASPPNASQRLYVAERSGQIQLVPNVSSSSPTKQLFFDLKASLQGRNPSESLADWWTFGESGLLGLAFHPNFETNGYFYISYTVHIAGAGFYQRVSRFRTGNHPDVVDPASEQILIQQIDRGPNHQGGDLHFGPKDGYLYYAAGDEENSHLGILNSQKITGGFFSGVFRIDVDKKSGNIEPNAHESIPTKNGLAGFSIPMDNPFVHTSLGGTWTGTYNGQSVSPLNSTRMEYWATGLRHVWRMSFDSETGDLWAGDVGQNNYEEVNRITKSGNYGWGYRDGNHDTNGVLGSPPSGFSSIAPFYEYLHTHMPGGNQNLKGNSVLGGYIYRGERMTQLQGKYIFSDSVAGHIWSLDPVTSSVSRIAGVPGAYGIFSTQGIDPSNRDLLFAEYINGKILRLVQDNPNSSAFPNKLSQTGLFSDLSDLSPSPGLIAYEPNLPFWSDYAIKRRWFTIPNESDKMTWSKNGNWSFPAKMVWVKHFDIELQRGNPLSKKRLETRVLVKTGAGSYGVSYRWNDAQDEAFLVPESGDEFDLSINVEGETKTQRWQIPSRTNCLTCHTPQAGHALSFNTGQLNRSDNMNGYLGNQLTSLATHGYLANTLDHPSTLRRYVKSNETSFSLEERVRSYLAVNCAYCHQNGGTANGNWDGRFHLTLEQTNLVSDSSLLASHLKKYIVPGQVAQSHLLQRVQGSEGTTRMPPIGTNEIDHSSIQLLKDWIESELPNRKLYKKWQEEHFALNDADGAKSADKDEDGVSNYEEYLLGTNPNSGILTPAIQLDANRISFERNAFRYYSVEKSTDLVNWQPIEGLNTALHFREIESEKIIPLPTPMDAYLFFRLQVTEP